jgi:ribonuclease HII
LRDSKLLTAAQRERCYDQIVGKALAWSVVAVGPAECDRLGMHRADLEALRRALLRLEVTPAYVLSDGFSVDGLGMPGLSIWKGDQVAACVSAASVVAKVTRDAMMAELDAQYPEYQFGEHKGYCTALHQRQLDRFGPCPVHRMRFENVVRSGPGRWNRTPPPGLRRFQLDQPSEPPKPPEPSGPPNAEE